ncbi:carboxypeptidase-like regulatory domain-containing protein [Blastopirellula marina]|uniref:Carboxypeptidase regulatory-like domain-containing protein n=1 Tax=Blastopirellula marina DSM 3645 TaxID=314230 RepID=A3ZN57_9BACT|nr:carboxypeptidase-like regulatory domain-containing protein [Blastopirellula marina]EAQ82386.1 hypothetical protein DSM3645_01690 [Blastopirellula marina DSM 3645]
MAAIPRFYQGISLAVVAALMGCTGNANVLQTEYVEGVVTLDGVPVEGATVEFVPTVEEQGATANGYTDSSGIYHLTVLAPGDGKEAEFASGTLPGEYQIAVRKAVTGPTPASSSRQVAAKKTYLVPKKYDNPRNSGLTATVEAGSNTIPLELQSK